MIGFESFFLALVRYSAFIFLFPLFANRGVPTYTKIGFAALMALAVPSQPIEFGSLLSWSTIVIQEIVIGILLAFVITLVFAIVRFSGQLVDVPMGFGMVSVFDPQTGTQVPIFSQYYYMLAMLIFLAVDGHLWVLKAVARSYEFIPANSFFNISVTFEAVAVLASQIFLVGLQIAAPVIGTVLLTDIALGIITRTVPQINVFVLGFPIKIAVGLLMIILAVPAFVSVAARLFSFDGILMEFLIGLMQPSH